MKGLSGENTPVKRSNGEFLPLAVRMVSGYSKDEQLAFEDRTVVFLLSSSPRIGQSSRASCSKPQSPKHRMERYLQFKFPAAVGKSRLNGLVV